jgi:DegV family protein with EDD domain
MSQPQRIAIVTDSTADLPPDVYAEQGIVPIPLNVHIGDETFRDRVDIDSEEFLRRLKESPQLPTTSTPAAGVFEQHFRDLAQNHDEILCVLLSSKLSATYQSAQIAAQAVADTIKVELVDSLNSSLALGFQAIRARELRDAGNSLDDIARTLRGETNLYHLVFFAETLEYLHRGGRIGKAATLVGSVLQLKPLMRVEEGVVVPFERTRTRKKALAGLASFVNGFASIDTVAVLHINTPDDAQAILEVVAPRANRMIVPIGQFGPVLAAHIGPGAVGVVVRETT